MQADKKIHLTFFLPSLEGGGAEKNVIHFIGALPKDDYGITIALAQKKGVFLSSVPAHVTVVDLNSKSLTVLFFKLRDYIKKNPNHIFISSFPRFNAISLLARKFSGAPVKVIIIEHKAFSLFATTSRFFVHRFIARFMFPHFIKLFYPTADAIICVSYGVKKDLLTFIANSPKISVIYNPVVTESIGQLCGQEVSHPWFFDKNVPIVLAVGRLIYAKDYPTLLTSFANVLKKVPVRLAILGEGDQRAALELRAAELGIQESVAFLGFDQNPYKYMSRASVFVLSSVHEGFGNVLVEAMACGVPVVSTDCKSGPSEIIQNGQNGLLVPPKDKEALAEALLKILQNPTLARTLAENGKKRAEYFTVQKSTQAYQHIFKQLTSRQ